MDEKLRKSLYEFIGLKIRLSVPHQTNEVKQKLSEDKANIFNRILYLNQNLASLYPYVGPYEAEWDSGSLSTDDLTKKCVYFCKHRPNLNQHCEDMLLRCNYNVMVRKFSICFFPSIFFALFNFFIFIGNRP